MTIDIYVYLIVLPFMFLAGFVDAIAGGGALIALPGMFIAGLPAHTALGTNKLVQCSVRSLPPSDLSPKALSI